jgi:hypothetical protein
MNDRQRRHHARGARVRDFSETVKASFPAGSKGAESAARIKDLVDRVAEHDASRAINTRTAHEGAGGKSDALVALRTLLGQVSRTARAISLEDPALRDRFQVPNKNPNMQAVVTTARSFIVEAEPLKARFIEYGMAADFLTRLDALVTDFESHAERRNTGANQSAVDNAAINSALDELDAEVARYVAIVQNKFAADAATLAGLRTASRLERAPRRTNNAAPLPANPSGDAPTA